MRIKTSITLPAELLHAIDQHDPNRSSFIERAVRAYLARIEKSRRDSVDVKIIECNAERLNQEASDVLEYQRLRLGAASFIW